MKIIVTSDSHGHYHGLKQIVTENLDADYVVFLGDGLKEAFIVADEFPSINFLEVKGNCDYTGYAEEREIEVLSKKIFMTHGHNYHVKRNLSGLIKKAHESSCDIALYGHTHIKNIAKDKNLHIMCPGSVYEDNSYGVITIADNGGIKMEVFQL